MKQLIYYRLGLNALLDEVIQTNEEDDEERNGNEEDSDDSQKSDDFAKKDDDAVDYSDINELAEDCPVIKVIL